MEGKICKYYIYLVRKVSSISKLTTEAFLYQSVSLTCIVQPSGSPSTLRRGCPDGDGVVLSVPATLLTLDELTPFLLSGSLKRSKCTLFKIEHLKDFQRIAGLECLDGDVFGLVFFIVCKVQMAVVTRGLKNNAINKNREVKVNEKSNTKFRLKCEFWYLRVKIYVTVDSKGKLYFQNIRSIILYCDTKWLTIY